MAGATNLVPNGIVALTRSLPRTAHAALRILQDLNDADQEATGGEGSNSVLDLFSF
jgi:hypothetical protein